MQIVITYVIFYYSLLNSFIDRSVKSYTNLTVPTGALNSKNTQAVLDVLSKMNQRGQSIVMVTHDLKSAERGNRILYLSDGLITSELDLGGYLGHDEKRRGRLLGFLQEMGW